ncbi:aldo/keto reductase family protein [Asticcacaulis biprosthecium C19]|uniref:Aldo/keto reductase family protein n=1 Tax=Asticcacaulis biprosthecium C19 TaxID=715226 RepID=F4QKL5_9CAUL|nr:aldo/keto reductase [Asticcacaulis biprosthecium]EGF92167.1 aldo/keto reductase family protein [Asticcacaulis biprosthecium C19]
MAASLGLGSAQFGGDYGISNTRGRVSEDEVRQILQLAADCKVLTVDSSHYDGDVERILGRNWPFPSPFKPQVRTLRLEKGLDWLESRLRRSVEHMGLVRVHAALIDNPEDLMGPQGDELWARLEKLKADGLISKIGISASYDDQPLLLARRFKPDVMQVPASILDQRLVRDGTLAALAKLGVEVQIRSVFLQGLLFLPREKLPANLIPVGPHLSRVRRIMAESGADPLHAALSFALNLDGVSTVVVGVTSAAELRAIIAASESKAPRINWDAMALNDEVALTPGMWFQDLGEKTQRRLVRVA